MEIQRGEIDRISPGAPGPGPRVEAGWIATDDRTLMPGDFRAILALSTRTLSNCWNFEAGTVSSGIRVESL